MARRLRKAAGGVVYHVLNRRAGRATLFFDDGDYAAFEKVLAEALARWPGVALLAYCLMPNHWHLLLRPSADGELSDFMQWLAVTHARRWHAHHGSGGTGPLYQGRFKSFPVQADGHYLGAARYVERNALRAGLVDQAQDWHWCSLWRRERGSAEQRAVLADWPVDRPADWLAWVNRAETGDELAALRRSLSRGAPFGDEAWQRAVAERLGLESSLRPPHRPRAQRTAVRY